MRNSGRYKQGIQLGVPCTADARASIILPLYIDSYVKPKKSFGGFIEYDLYEDLDKRIREIVDIGTKDFVKRHGGYQKEIDINVKCYVIASEGTRLYKGTVYMYDCHKLNIIYEGTSLMYHVMYLYMKEMRRLIYRTLKEFKPKDYKQTKKRNVLHTFKQSDFTLSLKEYKGSVVDQALGKYETYMDELPF